MLSSSWVEKKEGKEGRKRRKEKKESEEGKRRRKVKREPSFIDALMSFLPSSLHLFFILH